MSPATIDHATLARLVEAGAVRAAHVVGQRGGWAVVIRYGLTERALAAQRTKQIRLFRKFETLVGYLRGVGIVEFAVNATDYDADALKLTRRPDAAVQMRRAHQAAAHDVWFRGQVEQALTEANDPGTQWVTQDEVEAQSQSKRAEWRADAERRERNV